MNTIVLQCRLGVRWKARNPCFGCAHASTSSYLTCSSLVAAGVATSSLACVRPFSLVSRAMHDPLDQITLGLRLAIAHLTTPRHGLPDHISLVLDMESPTGSLSPPKALLTHLRPGLRRPSSAFHNLAMLSHCSTLALDCPGGRM